MVTLHIVRTNITLSDDRIGFDGVFKAEHIFSDTHNKSSKSLLTLILLLGYSAYRDRIIRIFIISVARVWTCVRDSFDKWIMWEDDDDVGTTAIVAIAHLIRSDNTQPESNVMYTHMFHYITLQHVLCCLFVFLTVPYGHASQHTNTHLSGDRAPVIYSLLFKIYNI